MARKAATKPRRNQVELCGEKAAHRVASIDVCDLHYRELEDWHFTHSRERDFRQTATRVRAAAAALREANRDYIHAVDEEWTRRETALAERSVVYYLRRVSDGMIKIGTTVVFRSRLTQHRRDHGELQILLIRGGTRDEEAEAHRKYGAYRAGRAEWFYPAQPLLRSIYRYRQGCRLDVIQPDDVLPMEEFRALVRMAPPRTVLRWDGDGVLLWPPIKAAA